MKKGLIFKDSRDDAEMTVAASPDNEDYIIKVGDKDFYLSPDDFGEFASEIQRFYGENERRKE